MKTLKYSLRLVETKTDWNCSFCGLRKARGSIGIEYSLEETVVKLTCLHHKVCETFHTYGFFCPNHEQNRDEDCSEAVI